MTPYARPETRRGLSSSLFACLAVFFVLHASLFAYDVTHPEAFYGGDRGDKRANKIYTFLDIEKLRTVSSPTWSSIPPQPVGPEAATWSIPVKLLNLGPPGDYLFHAFLYRIGGEWGVIAFQLLLGLIAVVCVFRLALLLGLPEKYAAVATALYILLPSSGYQLHQLVTEGLFNPLVAIATYLLVLSLEQRFRWRVFLSALVLLALAMQIRTQLLLYPIVLAGIFILCRRRDWPRLVVPTVAICFALPVAWLIFKSFEPAELVTAKTELDPLRNLSGIVERMSIRGGFPFDRKAYSGEQIPIPEFLSYVFTHPVAFLEAKTTDVVEVVFNPGITGLGKYLGAKMFTFRTEEGRLFWSQVKWNSGITGVVTELLRQDWRFLSVFLIASGAWFSVLALATFGAWVLIKDRQVTTATKAVLLSIVLYNLAIVQVGEMTRVTHRSPVEFVLAILFAIGVRRLVEGREGAPAKGRYRLAKSTLPVPSDAGSRSGGGV